MDNKFPYNEGDVVCFACNPDTPFVVIRKHNEAGNMVILRYEKNLGIFVEKEIEWEFLPHFLKPFQK